MFHCPSRCVRRFFPLSFCLLLFLISVPAQAKTFVITDGSRMVTYENSPVAASAETAGIRQMKEVFLFWRGTESAVSTDCQTVEQLLAQLGLELCDTDILSISAQTPIRDGMTIRVDSMITRRETYTTTLPREVQYCTDATLPAGTSEILIEGQDGELLCTADITYCNGIEVKREILRQDLSLSSIPQVVAQGTAAPAEQAETSNMPIIEDGYIIMPSGEILTYYKTDFVTATGYTHTDEGCDMTTATGTTVHYGTAAVDPRFIPYGTRMLIMSHDGERYYGIATAEDCGGAIKRDRMDLYFPTYQECIEFGRRRCTIYFLG